jgi:uncharacterized protein (TIGR04255 family)
MIGVGHSLDPSRRGAFVADFSGRLKNAPVVYALCQVRFSPVLKIRDMVPDIQEGLRDIYEGFEEEQITGIQIGPTASMLNETRWRFEKPDRRAGYVLTNSSLVYHTTAYSDFDEFVIEVMRGVETVSNVAKIQRFVRAGIRYVDLIEGDSNHRADSFLHERLRGFVSELPYVSDSICQYLSAGKTDIGNLVMRVTIGAHEVALPPDLLPIALTSVRIPNKNSVSVFLDTDHFVDAIDPPIPRSEVSDMIKRLKVAISTAFKQAITQDAVDTWK